MARVYILIIACLGFYISLRSRWFCSLRQMWRDGDFGPPKEKLTMFDVRRLLIKGERGVAIRIYCELFKVNVKEASEAVDEIERSIQPKDFEF